MAAICRLSKWSLAIGVLLPLRLSAQPTPSASEPPPIEPKAVEILKAACDTLAAAKAMSFTAVSTYEKAARNGQPLFYTTLNQVTMQRPDKLRVITPGDGTPDEFYYDGKTITAYVPSADLVAVADAPPTIEQMIDVAWRGGDLLPVRRHADAKALRRVRGARPELRLLCRPVEDRGAHHDRHGRRGGRQRGSRIVDRHRGSSAAPRARGVSARTGARAVSDRTPTGG